MSMVSVRFRVVKAGMPEAPVRVFPITQDDGPPVFHEQEALRRLKSHVRQQQAQSEPEIRAHLEARLTGAEKQRLSHLLEQYRVEGLTPEQQAETQALFDPIEAVATE